MICAGIYGFFSTADTKREREALLHLHTGMNDFPLQNPINLFVNSRFQVAWNPINLVPELDWDRQWQNFKKTSWWVTFEPQSLGHFRTLKLFGLIVKNNRWEGANWAQETLALRHWHDGFVQLEFKLQCEAWEVGSFMYGFTHCACGWRSNVIVVVEYSISKSV